MTPMKLSDRELLRRVLEHSLSEEEREAFEDMSANLEKHGLRSLSPRQRQWVQRVLEDHEPTYENAVSAGTVPLGRPVELLPCLRPENLPLKPPGRR